MERVEDLQFQGLRIIQDTELACFSQDAVLLSNFLCATANDRVVDLGCGNGIVAILGQGKTGAAFTGVELQPALCALAQRSAALNGQQIPFLNMDVRDAPRLLGCGSFTAAVCNPPYFHTGDRSCNESRAAARHDDAGGLDDFFHAAFLLLKNRGNFFLCYPAAQLVEVFAALRRNRLEPKRMRLVAFSDTAAPTTVLIASKKDAKPGLCVEPVLHVMKME